jgi:Bacterial Ig-like domain (group 2)
MRATLRVAVVLVAGVLGTAACSGAARGVTEACPADLRVVFSPQDTTIQAGQQFPIHFTLLGCGGTQTLTDSVTYASANTAVATVGASSGVVSGVAAGATTIVVTGHHYGVTVNVAVTVK